MRRLAALLGVLACGGERSVDPVDHPAPPAEARQVAEALVDALNRCDREAIDTILDVRLIAARGVEAGGVGSGDQRRGCVDLVAETWDQANPCAADAVRSRFTFVRLNQVGKASRPLVRWHQSGETGELGFVELVVEKPPDKPPRLVDVVSVFWDGSLARDLNKVFVNVASRDQSGMIADTLYIPLSVGLRAPSAHLTRIIARQPPSTIGPGDPARPAEVIRRGFMRNDLAGIPTAIDTLELRVGADPLLESLRAVALIASDQAKEAVRIARAAVRSDPDLEEPWVILMHAATRAGDLASALEAVDTLAGRFDLDPRTLLTHDGLEALTGSDEFRRRYDTR